jgi:hypothetical protein
MLLYCFEMFIYLLLGYLLFIKGNKIYYLIGVDGVCNNEDKIYMSFLFMSLAECNCFIICYVTMNYVLSSQ